VFVYLLRLNDAVKEEVAVEKQIASKIKINLFLCMPLGRDVATAKVVEKWEL
jgi:hypothetical protein